MSYIKLEDLRKFPFRLNTNEFNLGVEAVIEYAENLPTADVVELRHGEWLECSNELNKYCSICGKVEGTIYEKPPFCKNCGAKMNGGKF